MKTIEEYRQKIDQIDFKIIKLLKERSLIVESIGKIKIEQNISVMQKSRVEQVLNERKKLAESLQLEQEFIEELFKMIILYSCKIENNMELEKGHNK